jgi:peptidoglycan/LPS O-acetylase OafA/YrhL
MRNKRLDILRCIALLLVMIHHARVSSFFARVGWTGVDLFFVLSGFLISGLLFSEWQRCHSIDFKKFLIRRGLKIYPAFYSYLLLTAITSYGWFHSVSTSNRYLHEVFFVQNYEPGIWDHTWSLAVEEHFYICLPVFLLVLVRLAPGREDPFRVLPWTSLAIATMCVAFRAGSIYIGMPNFHMVYTATHERMDSLFFGVLLGYLYHFRPLVLQRRMQPTANRLAMAAVSAGLLCLAYFLPRENRFFALFGYSFLYLGFGGVLLLALYVRDVLPGGLSGLAARVGAGLAFVGMYSYSIYLWHGPCGAWLPGLLRRTVGFPTGPIGRFAVYFGGSLIVGISMSRVIEYPVLRLRDRLFPDTRTERKPTNLVMPAANVFAADAMLGSLKISGSE